MDVLIRGFLLDLESQNASSATLNWHNGGNSLVLQRILGHTTLDMTNRYINMLTDDLTKEHNGASPLTNLK